jgi:hypothetical protein
MLVCTIALKGVHGGEMRQKSLYLSLAALIMSSAAWADIIQIDDLTDGPTVSLINNVPSQPASVSQSGSISNLVVDGETVTFTYTLPANLTFGGNFNAYRQMLEGQPDGDSLASGVSDIFRAVWLQGASTAAISFSSDPDTIPLDDATKLPDIMESGAFQSVVTVPTLNLDFQVASDVPEPSSLLGCAGILSAITVGLYRRRIWR